MTRVIMHGCNGKMGQVITKLIAEDDTVEIVAGVDVYHGIENAYPVFDTLEECDVEGDVVIDFATVAMFDSMLDSCVKKQIPCVLCTTGLSEAQIAKITEASKKVAVLKSANMSLGINMFLELLKKATAVLEPAGFDIEIVEKHHNKKVDAPSGTALALADSINEELNNEYKYVYDRSTVREARGKKEIGLSAVRGGTIVGDHDVIFAGDDEVITFSHRAYSKAVFGKGAIAAAKFLKGKEPGWYEMSDVIKAQI